MARPSRWSSKRPVTQTGLYRAKREGGDPELLLQPEDWGAADVDAGAAVGRAVMVGDDIFFTLAGYYTNQPTDAVMRMRAAGSMLEKVAPVRSAWAHAADEHAICWAE